MRYNTENFELVPRERLSGDIPDEIINDFSHWFNQSTHEVEFRPRKSIWTSSSCNWRMTMVPDTRSWMLKSGTTNSRIIDVGSRSSKMITAIFSVFDEPRNLMMTTDESGAGLHVRLSRYELEFSLSNHKQLSCRNFPGMIIDLDQEIGTFIGLRNTIVLRTGELP
jgi:hypothetical protein